MTATVTAGLSSEEVCELTGITYRMLEHWCTSGLLGRALVGRGQGYYRRFTTADVEAVDTIRALRSLGCRNTVNQHAAHRSHEQALLAAIDVVRARPVAPTGEWLLVTLDPPRARRHDTYLLDNRTAADSPLWAIRLRSFTAPASTSSGGSPPHLEGSTEPLVDPAGDGASSPAAPELDEMAS